MFNRLTIKIACGVLLALFLLSYTVYAAIDTKAPITEREKLAADPGIKEHRFELAEPRQEPKLNEQQAITRAREIVGTAFSADQATSVSAVYTLFTDNETPKLPEKEILLKNLHVWIVTFDGLKIAEHGPRLKDKSKEERFHSQLHVVIDANTGEELEMFSYK